MEAHLKLFDGRVYRIRPVVKTPSILLPHDDTRSSDVCVDEKCEPDAECDVSNTKLQDATGESAVSSETPTVCEFRVPSLVVGRIVGRGGATKAALQKEHRVLIDISKKSDAARGTTDVRITGDSAANVTQVKQRIDAIVRTGIQQADYTHFVSIPLTEGGLEGVTAFRERVLEHCSRDCEGLDSTVFVAPTQLHVTLVMLKLLSTEAVLAASSVFRSLSEAANRLFGPSSRRIDLKGLEYMNDDPAAVHVLYAKLDSGAATRAIEAFVVNHLLPALKAVNLIDDDELRKQRMLFPDGSIQPKLHVTLINTKLRRTGPAVDVKLAASRQKSHAEAALAEATGGDILDDEGGKASKVPSGDRVPVDCRPILTKFGDRHIATAEIRDVHLSARGKFASNGYYPAVEILKLP